MQKPSLSRGFTLIELLTVIAIIAVLAAILFPIAGTVREQARASDCMTKLHQLWVAANVYRQDEGVYPSALLGYVENPDGTYNTSGAGMVAADRIVNGFLYAEQTKAITDFRCPDNPNQNKLLVTIAHFPPRPAEWPAGVTWVGDSGVSGCPSDAYGVVDCFREPEVDAASPFYHQPKYFYIYDAYDIGPRIDPNTGRPVPGVYDLHYSPDWTGVTGRTDMPNQLKYQNPPSDKTILTYCTWHASSYGSNTAPSISMAGIAKKMELAQFYRYGPDLYNR